MRGRHGQGWSTAAISGGEAEVEDCSRRWRSAPECSSEAAEWRRRGCASAAREEKPGEEEAREELGLRMVSACSKGLGSTLARP